MTCIKSTRIIFWSQTNTSATCSCLFSSRPPMALSTRLCEACASIWMEATLWGEEKKERPNVLARPDNVITPVHCLDCWINDSLVHCGKGWLALLLFCSVGEKDYTVHVGGAIAVPSAWSSKSPSSNEIDHGVGSKSMCAQSYLPLLSPPDLTTPSRVAYHQLVWIKWPQIFLHKISF